MFQIEEKVLTKLYSLFPVSGSVKGPKMKDIRRLFISTMRSIISYGCGAWFFEEVRPKDPLSKFAIRDAQVERLEVLQANCLRFVAGAYSTVPRQEVEKDVFIDSIRVYLRRMASAYRTRTVHNESLIHLRACRPKIHPYSMLYDRAIDQEKDIRRQLADRGTNVEERWKKPHFRSRDITNYYKKKAFNESSDLWDTYRFNRLHKEQQSRKGQRPRPILMEKWGPQALKYHDNLRKIESTMLTHFRTGFNGLNRHLKFIGVLKGDDDHLCECGREADDVEHRFLRCPLLRDARKQLKETVGHLDLTELLTRDARAATKWAIRHWGLAQFEWTNRHMPDSPHGEQ